MPNLTLVHKYKLGGSQCERMSQNCPKADGRCQITTA